MNIWHLENKNFTRLILLRTDKDNFTVIQAGNFQPLLGNSNYLLIDKKYSDLFTKITDQVTFHEVKISDRNLNIENDIYIELNIANVIDAYSIKLQDSDGLKIWKYEGNIFVSADLKAELYKISNDDFEFSVGFSHFG
jgi:hypothetical protein